jgi:hypothetical protein
MLCVAIFLVNPAVAQQPAAPNLYAVYDLYIPCSLSIRLALPDQIIEVKDKIVASPTSGYQYGKGRSPLPNPVYVVNWNTNSSDSWLIDIYVNYTMPISEDINYVVYGVDSTGIQVGAKAVNTRVMGQVIWLHFEITTRIPPHYPTPEQQMGYLFGENSPFIIWMKAQAQATADMASNQQLLGYAVIILIIIEVAKTLNALVFARKRA